MTLRPSDVSPQVRRLLRHYWRVAGVGGRDIWLPAALIVLGSLFDAFSFGLLIPLAEAVGENGFGFLESSRFFGWLANLVPASIAGTRDGDRFLIFALIGLIIVGRFGRLAVDYVRRVFTSERNERYRFALSQDTFRRVLGFGRQYFNRQSLGGVDAEVAWSSAAVHVLEAVESAVQLLFTLVAQLVVMVGLSLPLTVAFAIVMPVVQRLMRWIQDRVRAVAEEATAVEHRLRREALDLLSTMALVKAFSQEQQASDRYAQILDESRGLSVKHERIAAAFWPLAEVVILVAMLLVEGVIIYMSGGFRPGDLATFAAFLLLLQYGFPSFNKVAGLGIHIANELPRLEGVAALYSEEEKYIVPSGTDELTSLEDCIRIEGLTFEYVPGTPVLSGVSAVFPAHSVTALVGKSGSGKTTLVDLIARFYDTAPRAITFDGKDVRDFSLGSLHSRMALVSQEVWLLNRSVRENLTFGLDRTPDDAELMETLHAVELGSFVEALSARLETEIGDRGVRLSGGQRQRLAIARALLRRPEILILDEATSSLDSIVERRVEESIEKYAAGRTLIVIAHRLSTVRSADHVLVMQEGRIVESGTWDELLAAEGALAELYGAQAQGITAGGA